MDVLRPSTASTRPNRALNNYLIMDELLPTTIAASLADRVESHDAWKIHNEWFFSQYDAAWVRRTFDQPQVGAMTSELNELYRAGQLFVESRFGAVVGGRFTILTHKMLPGQVIGIHNDSPAHDRGRTENFRLIYYVDRDYSDAKGGHLYLFSERDESAPLDGVRPLFNSAVLLALSDFSYHAVGRVLDCSRFSIVVSYWAYPLLLEDEEGRRQAEQCIKRMIVLGYENVPHSRTSFLDHLYGTYRMLVCWGAEPAVCLAGLTHSLLGRPNLRLPIAPMEVSELEVLIGREATELVVALSGSARPTDCRLARPTLEDELFLIELANDLEQVEELDEVERVAVQFRYLPRRLASMREIIETEIELRREFLTRQRSVQSQRSV